MITWSASNNSNFLNGVREAKDIASAVRAGRKYVRSELYGEGKLTIYRNGIELRQDECSIFTNYKWVSNNI